MDENIPWRYRRWQEADEAGRDDDADAACRNLFASVAREPVASPDFSARTLAAIAAATAHDLRRARRVRRTTVGVGLAGTAVGIYVGGGWALALLSSVLVGVINLLVGATVRAAAGLQAGTDIWTMLAGLGRAAAAFVADPTITAVMLGMQGLAMAALIALRRLLESDRESFK
jgi:hypothetical protein